MRKGFGIATANIRSNTVFLGCAMDAMMERVMNMAMLDEAADAFRRAL